ncbi:IDEAL domain-containing protein [Paenibacillus sophorae]|uniref:IDEAL domain-containing protein n=1 Tax=Paenibacillus sophorae TaxID=1333845 RepID=A0A1H8LAF8_9BACL|nr:IDEAL domain-containing protein [Paenibacillus sophorae]QWU17363.1 IDEAL domain-containing protein [Paenibacillus sophorae]SEO02071.1 IDEAL domain-containing protein [Paenibacillus sophorae]
MFIDAYMQMRYEQARGVLAEVILENAIKRFREKRIRMLIDQALDQRDAKAFYRYSAELAGIRKDEIE